MPRDVDVNDAATLVGEHDEDELEPALDRRDREEVHRDGRPEVIVEERTPGL
jgi:hypothetical protein